MHEVKIPKVLFLALDIAQFYRSSFFNTNDLATLANQYKKELVRLRVDKKDYKYLEDTNFGGLRGNFSTLLTWRGLVKRGSQIVSSYSLGKDNRLLNAVCKGDIILNPEGFIACTNDEKIKNILETEAWLLNVREKQAHVKVLLKKDKSLPLTRDNINFPKESVFKSSNSQFFIRAMLNNFVDPANKIVQYNIINLWQGKKFKQKNIHVLIAIPSTDDAWNEIYAIKNEDLFNNKPILLNVNLQTKECKDKNGITYPLYALNDAIQQFSKENDNISTRLSYSWEKLKKDYCDKEVDYEVRKEDEFSNFLRLFLNWNKNFSVDNKDVEDVIVVSSGGPDVELIFSGGTKQKLELEHDWKNYLDHGHQNNGAFSNVWIFAEERFDENKILKLFGPEKIKNNDRIPDTFLCLDKDNVRKAYKADWDKQKFSEIQLSFLN